MQWDDQLPFVVEAEARLPRQRGNVRVSNRQVLRALLHVEHHRCSWRELPPSFGNWHTIYTRVRRWEASGVLRDVLPILRLAQAAQPARQAPSAPKPPLASARMMDLAEGLRPLIFMLYAHLKRERHQLDLSQFEVALLMMIEETPGVGTHLVAARLESSAATVSVSVRRLAALGCLVSRRGDDGRRLELHITDHGRRLLNDVRMGRSGQLMQQFARMDAADLLALEQALRPLRCLGRGLAGALAERAPGRASRAARARRPLKA